MRRACMLEGKTSRQVPVCAKALKFSSALSSESFPSCSSSAAPLFSASCAHTFPVELNSNPIAKTKPNSIFIYLFIDQPHLLREKDACLYIKFLSIINFILINSCCQVFFLIVFLCQVEICVFPSAAKVFNPIIAYSYQIYFLSKYQNIKNINFLLYLHYSLIKVAYQG